MYPLTGLPAPDALTALRPVVVAKVGNYDNAPPTGLNVADIVFEELINDNVSRFAVVFHSQFPDEAVGPIRSGRLQDVNLLGSLNQPILAWSGGNGTVTRAIDDSDLVNLSPQYCRNSCFRVDFAKVPYNLYYDIEKAYDVGTTMGAGNPNQVQFQFREPGDAVSGDPSSGVKVAMDSYDTEWTWNPDTGLYERSQNGRPHDERNGDLITTDNVVVMAMAYFPGISGSPDAQSVGYGEVWVFSGGTVVHGVWSRADRTEPFTLTADDGTPILLTPGRTFVQLPRDEPGLIEVKPA
ncbi:MAG TPA: hypothetical protein DCR14_05535 [Acidimicrobiaceae bacterium]|nr:hypothetical protein [Acidimicrobiaceae bacterium]